MIKVSFSILGLIIFVLFFLIPRVGLAEDRWCCRCASGSYKSEWASQDDCRSGCPGYCATKGSAPLGNMCNAVATSAECKGGGKVGLENPLGKEYTGSGQNQLRTAAGNIIRAVLGVIGSLSILMFFYGGFLWLTAMGSPEKIKKGQQTLFWATVGIAFIFASYVILRFVFKVLDPTFVG